MSNPIVILHGWSDRADSFRALKAMLNERLDREIEDIKLVDWLSMDDDISYDDIAAALNDEWTRRNLSRAPHSVDFVVHSTGALILRHWLVNYFAGPEVCPAKRILMLAPANYGSFLADEGKSFMGRVVKGRFSDTGKKLLDGLELASDYTQKLAHKDVFKNWYQPSNGLYVTILIGDGSYGGFSGLMHKKGSDNTVMTPCASLESLQIDYLVQQSQVEIKNKGYATEQSFESLTSACDTAFCVLKGINHSEVTGREGFESPLDSLMIDSLTVSEQTWEEHKDKINQHSHVHANPFSNVVLSVTDQLGQPVNKYVMLMSVRDLKKSWQIYKARGIKDVHRNTVHPSKRAFYVDTKLFFESLRKGLSTERELVIKIVADPSCEFNESGKPSAGFLDEDRSPEIVVSPKDLSKLIQAGRTSFLNVQIPRVYDRVSVVRQDA